MATESTNEAPRAPDDDDAQTTSTPHAQGHLAHAAEVAVEALVGAAAGAALGVLGGPPGMVAGAIIGGAVAGAAGEALHDQNIEKERADEQLDRDIGVTEGNLGEASPDQPPSTGRFHSGSLGIAADAEPEPGDVDA
jgi:phage tail tape-measure protein